VLNPELQRKISEIVGPMYCPEGYGCVEAGLEQLRKEGTDNDGTFLLCLRSNPVGCAVAVPRGALHECRCVLRASLAQKLH
jgi:hypothetical protein